MSIKKIGIFNAQQLFKYTLLLVIIQSPFLAITSYATENPQVTSLPAELYGANGATLNGSINPRGIATSYYFEYFITPNKVKKTKEIKLPPRKLAFYREDWNSGAGGWRSWVDLEVHKPSLNQPGFVRSSEPANHDHNHDYGLGPNHLVSYLYSGLADQSVFLGGGEADLRDAKVSLTLRGNNWQPNGTELVWWSQCQLNPQPIDRIDWLRANWAYTGFLLTDYLMDGKWHTVSYNLENNSSKWSYAGGRREYKYGSIDQCQKSLNYNFFNMLIFVNPDEPPAGSIDFDNIEISYRNYSLLIPSNGGRLLSAPNGGNPSLLTDGWRNGEGREWRSPKNPTKPLEFIYSFNTPVQINKVQIHQSLKWPSKDVEILISSDGKSYKKLISKSLPNESIRGPNWAFSLDKNLDAPAGWLKLVIKSGYKQDYWGLGEVEVFGHGAEMLPDEDVYFVNQDIADLELGKLYKYKLIAIQNGKYFPGEVKVLQTASIKEPPPNCITGNVSRATSSSARLDGRVNPQSKATRIYFEFSQDKSNLSQKTKMKYAGVEMSYRLVTEKISGLSGNTKYYYRIAAKNASGSCFGAIESFSTK